MWSLWEAAPPGAEPWPWPLALHDTHRIQRTGHTGSGQGSAVPMCHLRSSATVWAPATATAHISRGISSPDPLPANLLPGTQRPCSWPGLQSGPTQPCPQVHVISCNLRSQLQAWDLHAAHGTGPPWLVPRSWQATHLRQPPSAASGPSPQVRPPPSSCFPPSQGQDSRDPCWDLSPPCRPPAEATGSPMPLLHTGCSMLSAPVTREGTCQDTWAFRSWGSTRGSP